ncbi:alpha-ketoacid dehydrogenase subunit beta [Candidatus Poribacteria bacterium]|nr:alpha-ketoacid dehydrogenase subunit beta [Candidatus Poribacteria bacterium]
MKQVSYSQAISEAIREEMEQNPNVVYIGECVEGRYGSRSFEMPISESGFTGMGIGAAIAGLRPIVEIMFSDFITVAMDPIVNQGAKIRYMFGGMTSVPIVIRAPFGGYVSMSAQHSQSLESMVSGVPGLKVVIPSNPYDAKGLMKSAIQDDNPVIFCDHKRLSGLIGQIPEEDYNVPIGKANIIRNGKDATIITYGFMVQKSLEAAEKLKQDNIDVEIVDLRTTLPLDHETILNSIGKTGKLITVAEACAPCSVASEVAAIVMEKGFHLLKSPLCRIHSKFSPIPFARNLEEQVLPQVGDIIKGVKNII